MGSHFEDVRSLNLKEQRKRECASKGMTFK